MRRVAVVHDWLVTWGGAERVLEQILAAYPEADVFALIEGLEPERRVILKDRRLTTSFIQQLPGARNHFWYYAGLMPLAVEQFDLNGYDLVLSSSHATALGAITNPDQVHVSYVHSPLRFIWDLQPLYLDVFGFRRGPRSALARVTFHYLRIWDRSASHGVDRFIANSAFVARRVRKTYRREATVIHPPVDTGRFALSSSKDSYFLAGSRMNPFKRLDLVVEGFRQFPKERLVVVGDGPHEPRVKALAGPNVHFAGHVSDEELTGLMRGAAAFVHAAKEDFGIAMAEALATGTPVIALGKGGATEIVKGLDDEQPTGVLFESQSAAGVAAGVRAFLCHRERFSPETCRGSVLRFDQARFRERYRAEVEEAWSTFNS